MIYKTLHKKLMIGQHELHLKRGVTLMRFRRVSNSCSTTDIHSITLVTNPVISQSNRDLNEQQKTKIYISNLHDLKMFLHKQLYSGCNATLYWSLHFDLLIRNTRYRQFRENWQHRVHKMKGNNPEKQAT